MEHRLEDENDKTIITKDPSLVHKHPLPDSTHSPLAAAARPEFAACYRQLTLVSCQQAATGPVGFELVRADLSHEGQSPGWPRTALRWQVRPALQLA